MKGKRYTEEQILQILREVESGTSVVEVCRQYNVAEATVYRWRQKYKGLEESQLKRPKELETENTRLKKIVAQQALDNDVLKDLLGKDW